MKRWLQDKLAQKAKLRHCMPRNIMQLVHELNPLPTSVRRGFFMGFGQHTLRRSQAALTCNQGRSPAPRAARSSTAPGHSSCSARSSPPPCVFNGSTTETTQCPAGIGHGQIGDNRMRLPPTCPPPQKHRLKPSFASHRQPGHQGLRLLFEHLDLSGHPCSGLTGRRSLFAGIQ